MSEMVEIGNKTLADFLNEQPDSTSRLDAAEAWIIANGGRVIGVGSSKDPEFKTGHTFTPGMYVRELFLPAGSVNVSKIHRTEHPFVVLVGRVSVYSDNDGAQHIRAPYFGITRVGSRRLVVAHENTVWLTFHATDLKDVDEIEKMIIEKYKNPLITGRAGMDDSIGVGGET